MDAVRERVGHCPVCGIEIDMLLAPALAVVDGRVVSFCSDRCKKDFLDGSQDGTGAVQDLSGTESHERKTGGFISWIRGRSSRVLLLLVAGFAGVIGVVGYHLACAMRYRPSVTAVPAEAAPAKRRRAAPAVISSTLPSSISPRVVAPSRRDVLRRARTVAHELLHREGYRLQIQAAEVLLRCCPEDARSAKAVLMEQALHGSWARRRLAAEALARAGIVRGREILVKDLTSPRRSVRLSAALSLARLGDKRARAVLRSFVGARRYRLTCAEALLHLGSDKARRILRMVVRSRSTRRADRVRAAAALAGAGDEQAVQVLGTVAAHGNVGWPGWLAMARAGLPGTRGRLMEALRYPALRLPAARILVARKMKADPRVLWNDLSAPDEEARATAAVAALWLGMEAR